MHELLTWHGWLWITVGACVVGLVAALAFVIRFQMESRGAWRGNPFGRFLMKRKIILAALFSLILLNRAGWDWWEAIRLPVTAILMVLFALQTFVPYRLLVEARQERASEERQAS